MKSTTELLLQLKSAAQEEIMCREASDTSDAWQDLASPENVLALLEIALPVLEQQGGWISCSERMPEKDYVLAADFNNRYSPSIPRFEVGIFADWFDDGKPTWDDGDGNDLHLKEVTHWQPIAPQAQPSTTPQIDNDGREG